MTRFVTVTLIIVGPQLEFFLLYVYTFYAYYNTDWIANMEIDLDPSGSVIKRLRCTYIYLKVNSYFSSAPVA